jgi:hypothetical protein
MYLNQLFWLMMVIGSYYFGRNKGFRKGIHMGIQAGLKGKKFLSKEGFRK